MKINKLTFVTRSKHKIKEARAIVDGIEIEQLVLDVPEIQSIDVEEVVREKAKTAAKMADRAVVVEDTGLYIEAFNGFPGALIKHVIDSIGNKGILKLLDGESNRAATAKVALAFCEPNSEPIVFVGETKGHIATEERGDSGFGFDPIFIPDGCMQTYAEMGPENKNKISHRKKALEKLKAYL